jgi:hypothetical protein
MRGGKRVNAGRKPGCFGVRRTLSVRLSAEVSDFLRAQSKSAGSVIEDCLRRTADFIEWANSRQEK